MPRALVSDRAIKSSGLNAVFETGMMGFGDGEKFNHSAADSAVGESEYIYGRVSVLLTH